MDEQKAREEQEAEEERKRVESVLQLEMDRLETEADEIME